ncbi:MAG: glutamine synthetase [Rickettsiales bacterium]|nr:glutamine synthetase [Rickettsiales bacterium]
MDFKKILQFYKEKLYREFNLIPVLGYELEFYITLKDHQESSYLSSMIIKNWLSEIISYKWNIVKECGFNQFEIQLNPTTNILFLFEVDKLIKEKIIKALKHHKAKISFAAKPFNNQPSSALHTHLNFIKKIDNNYINIKDLKFVIGGLLHTLADFMICFAPNIDSYKRYSLKSMTTPKNISWGYNNRTTALRILHDSEGNPRIEHRVAGSDAELSEIIAAILCGSYFGLKQKILPIPPTYGLAFDSQYNLTPLPTNLIEAKKNFTKSQFWDMFNALI